jgi:hypothetical protein
MVGSGAVRLKCHSIRLVPKRTAPSGEWLRGPMPALYGNAQAEGVPASPADPSGGDDWRRSTIYAEFDEAATDSIPAPIDELSGAITGASTATSSPAGAAGAVAG